MLWSLNILEINYGNGIDEALERLDKAGCLVEAKMSLKDKLNNAKRFNMNQDLNKDEILLIKIAKENGYELIGKDKDDDGSNRFIFEKKYRGETILFNASLYYENNDCQINYDFDYESGNDYFDETWGENLKTYEDEAIREIDEYIEEREWEDEDIDEALEKLARAGLIVEGSMSLKDKIANAKVQNFETNLDLRSLFRELTAFSNQLEQEGGTKVWITTVPNEYGIMASYTHDREDLQYVWKPNQGIVVRKEYYLGDLDDKQTIEGIKTVDDFKDLLRKDFGPEDQ